LFRLDGDVYRAEALEALTWLRHSFGTRYSPPLPDDAPVATLRQVHSDRVLIAGMPGVLGEGDAMITNQPGIALAIRTADCLPVLMADLRHRAVAAVHAGWRGAVAEIAPKTVAAMGREFGTRPEDLLIAIGPGIGACCFEVGPEVGGQFAAFFPERNDLGERTKVDLAETICRQLGRTAVQERQIVVAGLCPACSPAHFHSYRRDREQAGRMVTTIGLV